MSDEAGTSNQYEALSLEVERLRYQNERFRTHLERWRTDVEPQFAASEASRNMAFQFAQTGIKEEIRYYFGLSASLSKKPILSDKEEGNDE